MSCARRPPEVAVLHYPGAQLSATWGLTDVLGIASDRSRELGGDAAPVVRVTHWHPATPHGPVEKAFDTHGELPAGRKEVVVVAPSLRQLPEPPAIATLVAWLRERRAEGCVIASICSGAYVLAEAGLLDGRSATTHWCQAADFEARFPAVRLVPGSLLVDDGDIITAGAVMAWIDLGLRLVERLLGPAVAVAAARYMLFDPAGREQRHHSGFAPPLNHRDAAVLRVQHWLQATGAREVSLPAMAARAGLEERTFLRRFRKATGMRPTEYCQRIRVARGRELLEASGDSVAEIAWSVGYGDEGAFRKVFLRVVGLSPRVYRQRFRAGGAHFGGAA